VNVSVHVAVVALLCLALAGSVGACGTAEPNAGGQTPRPTPAGTAGAPSPSGAASPSPSTGTAPVRTDGVVVFDGDSLTEGFMLASSRSYPAQTMRQLPDGIAWENVAVSGQVWPDMLADVETEVDPLFSKAHAFNVVVAWASANDLAAGYTALEIYENARSYCLARRDRGFTVVVCTMYPLEPKDYDPGYEERRLEYNQLLRDRWREFADALVDLGASARIGDASPDERGAYFVDIVHLNEAGYGVIADAVAATLRPLIGLRD
jgi:lysophospholipase L1-like esterase